MVFASHGHEVLLSLEKTDLTINDSPAGTIALPEDTEDLQMYHINVN